MKPIKKSRKRKARKLREGKGTQGNTDGSESTHLMEWGEDKNKKGKKVYTVNPTIAPTGKLRSFLTAAGSKERISVMP